MKKYILILAIATVLTGCTASKETLANGGPEKGKPVSTDTSWVQKKYMDVAYADKSTAQKVDIYLPNEGTGPFPLIIEIHGGGFITGEKSQQITPMLEGLKRGYAVASVGYRLSKEAKFPAQINDVKAAIRFLRANSIKYNINPDRFATWGGSAGGALSAMAAVSGGVESLSDLTLGNAGVSDKVQASVDWFGPINFATMDAEFESLGSSGMMGPTNASSSAESRLLGKEVGTPEAQSLVDAANPTNYITSDDPPMCIEHGTADRNIPITQSINFSQAVAEVIGSDKVVYKTIEGGSHGGPLFETPENVEFVFNFLDTYLK